MQNISAEQLRSLFHYCPETGEFTRTANRGRWKAGTKAGSISPIGYEVINISGTPIYCHRLAFLWMTGEWPRHSVDHIDGDPLNNRWDNLRDIPQRANTHNIKKAKRQNSTGLLGVTWHAEVKKYWARIHHHGKQISLGLFLTPEEAHAAYLLKKRELHEGNTL